MKHAKKIALSPSELLVELKQMASEAQTMIGDTASQTSGEALEALQERLDGARERLNELYTTASRKVTKVAVRADTLVRENPYRAVTAGLLVGLFAGLVMMRSNGDDGDEVEVS